MIQQGVLDILIEKGKFGYILGAKLNVNSLV